MIIDGVSLSPKAIEKIKYLQRNENEYLKCHINTLHDAGKYILDNYTAGEASFVLNLIVELKLIEDDLLVFGLEEKGGEL